MKLAIDVHYRPTFAKAVGVAFQTWKDQHPTQVFEKNIEKVEPYVPGEFYKRELPCILSLLDQVDIHAVEILIIDGYVYLDDTHKAGLGKYLYDRFNNQIPVIGVAKSAFKSNTQYVKPILRGSSKKPLYISSEGIELAVAAEGIQYMHGANRMPDLLSYVDQLTKA